jgi:NTP pyrophosphatase (non-canonical NTP hydrolase)
MPDDQTTIADLRAQIEAFVAERDWGQFHSPKNLSMAIAIEAAELMEHFQWLTVEESRSLVEEEGATRGRVVNELADVLIYCLSLANALDIDLSEAIVRKLAHNARKYPADKYRGRF